jgi:transcriptional regulator of met regulon
MSEMLTHRVLWRTVLALLVALLLWPLLANFLPATFPLSPMAAHADSEKERRERITQALQDIAKEFGWDAGEVEYSYHPDPE